MPPIVTYPYLRPSDKRISPVTWVLASGSDPGPLPSALPGWDPTVDIHAKAALKLDAGGIFEDCGLGDGAVLRLGLVWYSSFTRLRGIGTQYNISRSTADSDYLLEVVVPGDQLGRAVELSAQIMLYAESDGSQLLAPATPGSRLAYRGRRLTIEGSGPRFPIEVMDFRGTRFPPEAAWALYWDPNELEQTIEGEICLYINSQHATAVRAVTRSEPQDHGVREALRYDLAQQLIFGALGNEDFVQSPGSYERGTVGAAVRGMLRLYFPGQSVQQVSAMARKPETFLPRLQAALKVFWGD